MTNNNFVTVNVTNDFNETGKERLKGALKSGATVRIYVDCVGQTQSLNVFNQYHAWLIENFKETLHSEVSIIEAFQYSLKK